MQQELTDGDLRNKARPHFAKGYNDEIFDVVTFARALLNTQDAEIAALRQALFAAQSHLRWTQFGECRTQGWDASPPTAAEADAIIVAALAHAVQPQSIANFPELQEAVRKGLADGTIRIS